jgi:oligosaccharide repeat unit polymerase
MTIKKQTWPLTLSCALPCLIVGILLLLKLEVVLQRLIWFVAGAGACLQLTTYCKQLRVSAWSPAVVYGIVFSVFHFGLVLPLSVAPSLQEQLEDYQLGWLQHSEAQYAVFYAQCFLAAFLLSVGSHLGWQRRLTSGGETRQVNGRLGYVIVGWLTLIAGLVTAGSSAASIGFSLSLSYNELFGQHNELSNGTVVVAVGLIFLLIGGTKVRTVAAIALLVYVPLASTVLLAGIRTGPMFSFVALGTAFYTHGARISTWLTLTTAIVGLTLISFVREIRTQGALNTNKNSAVNPINPASSVMELGGSLRPVAAVVELQKTMNAPRAYGSTYLWPLVRQYDKLAGRPVPIEGDDERFVASHINSLYGSIGFSTVAEAVHNGGGVGVVIFACAWGLILRVLLNLAEKKSNDGTAILFVLFVPMLINIRNSFIYVPGWIAVGIGMIFTAKLFSGFFRSKT